MKVIVLYIIPMAILLLVFASIGVTIEVGIVNGSFSLYLTDSQNTLPHRGYGAVIGIIIGLFANEYFFRAIIVKKCKLISSEDVRKVFQRF
jgi:membrane protease YdiL (CAAX protease family)